ncbi:DUF2231 domain-containing protein [Kribbella sp. NPDC023855]|uniref:DUF2231 domain-containing protein n=1 Tax=Kribbella sp. NPDC023855 TaxID=3154698 RepID=UPI0033E5C22D
MSRDLSVGAAGRGKYPKTVVAGPYGHPFHPVLVTVPIGSWVASVVFDVVALAGDDSAFAQGAYWLILIGLAGAVMAGAVGLLDLLNIPRGTPAFRTGVTHMCLNLTAIVLFVVGLFVRAANDIEETTVVGFILSLVALSILGASGWLGGKLAYHYGVRVATEETQQEGFKP